MYDLVRHGRGFVINLSDMPDEALERFVEWHNEDTEREEQQGTAAPPGIL